MTLLIFYLCIALFFSFLCSILEASLLSITPSYVGILEGKDPAIAKDLSNFKDNIDKPLAAILTLNTFAHTIGAAGVGAQAQLIWGEAYLTLTSIILTVIILFITEIIPKTLGANYWKQLTPFTVKTLKVMIFLLYPVIVVSQFITKRMKRDENKSVLSRADFTAMARIGTEEGVLQKDESRIINNILGFNAIVVNDIMTPRTVIKAASEKQLIIDFFNHTTLAYSRIPVYENSIDQITGYVLKDELMHKIIKGEGNKPLLDIKRPIEIVGEKLPIPKLFARIMEKNEHIALVVDEYGGTAGIVTMEDIVETLLGLEIIDEFDAVDDLQKSAREKWKKRAAGLGYQHDETPGGK